MCKVFELFPPTPGLNVFADKKFFETFSPPQYWVDGKFRSPDKGCQGFLENNKKENSKTFPTEWNWSLFSPLFLVNTVRKLPFENMRAFLTYIGKMRM